MQVSATLNGEAVTIVDVIVNGANVYITYIDSSTNLSVVSDALDFGTGLPTIIASGASV